MKRCDSSVITTNYTKHTDFKVLLTASHNCNMAGHSITMLQYLRSEVDTVHRCVQQLSGHMDKLIQQKKRMCMIVM